MKKPIIGITSAYEIEDDLRNTIELLSVSTIQNLL